MNAIEKFGEWCLKTLPVWALRLIVILLLVTFSIQTGIYKGRQLERETEVYKEANRSSQPPVRGRSTTASGKTGTATLKPR